MIENESVLAKFPQDKIGNLAILYVLSQGIEGKSLEEIASLYIAADKEIKESFVRTSTQYA